MSKACRVPGLLLVASFCAYKSLCFLCTWGGKAGSALLGFSHCCTPAKLPLTAVRVSPCAADTEQGTLLYSSAQSHAGSPVVNGCVQAPCWSNALDRRHWALWAGPHPHGPSFPPPGNTTTCKRHRDATALTSHCRHAVRPTTGAAL